jgi:hypothetical protein
MQEEYRNMNRSIPIAACVVVLIAVLYLPVRSETGVIENYFKGTWIPENQSSCIAAMRIEIQGDSVVFYNKNDSVTFRNLGICRSCGGASHGQGIEIQVFPEDTLPSPFIIRFNANEREGVMVVDMQDAKLSKRFPFGELKFKKCKK